MLTIWVARLWVVPSPGASVEARATPGYRLTPQQLGDFNAVAALRMAGGHPAA